MNGTTGTVIIFAGVFLAVLTSILALGGGGGRDKRKRIARVRMRAMSPGAPGEGGDTQSLARGGDGGRGFERFLAGLLPRRAVLRLRLQRAGLDMTPGRYATLGTVAAVITTSLFKLVFEFSFVPALLIGLVLGMMGPHIIIGALIKRRITRFNQLFPEAIDLMVRGLRSGLPIGETIINVGEETPDPVGGEFRAIADAVRLGATLEDALWDVAKRLDLPEFKFFTISLSVQRETGGNLGETLANLGDILRKRLTMRLKVKAMSSEARASAYIIGSLPFIMFGILMLMNPEYVLLLVTDPRGIMMTGVGLAMMGLGVGVMFKLVKFEI